MLCWRIDAFELWCWRRLLRVSWTARRSNQSILKETSPDYSLEGLMLKLKLQYLATWWEEVTHLKRPWCWERLKAGGEGDNRGWDCWMASLTQQTWVWVNSGCWLWIGKPGVLQSMGSQRVGHDWATEPNWNDILCSQRWRSSILSAKTSLRPDCGSDNELLIAKFRLKLKKVGKTTRPFRYDINKIPYDYTVEVTNRFEGIRSDRQSAWRTMDRGLWHCTGGSDQDHPQEKEGQNGCLRSPYK